MSASETVVYGTFNSPVFSVEQEGRIYYNMPYLTISINSSKLVAVKNMSSLY